MRSAKHKILVSTNEFLKNGIAADLVHGNILLGVHRRAVAVVGLRLQGKVGGSLD
jgi:hypothetical protein